MGLPDLFDLWCFAGILRSLRRFDLGLERCCELGDFVGCQFDFGHGALHLVANGRNVMDIFRRVKKYLTPDEYAALDKNVRQTPEGEVVPKFDASGRGELPDPVPLAPPVGWHANPSMFEVMRDMIRGEALRAYAEAEGMETFEEGQDFNVEDDDFPGSQYEGDFEPLEDIQARRQANFRRRFVEEEENASYAEWREEVLKTQSGSALYRQTASAARPAPKARPADQRPETAGDPE